MILLYTIPNFLMIILYNIPNFPIDICMIILAALKDVLALKIPLPFQPSTTNLAVIGSILPLVPW